MQERIQKPLGLKQKWDCSQVEEEFGEGGVKDWSEDDGMMKQCEDGSKDEEKITRASSGSSVNGGGGVKEGEKEKQSGRLVRGKDGGESKQEFKDTGEMVQWRIITICGLNC